LPGPSTGPIEQLTGRREPDRITSFLVAQDSHEHRNRLARIRWFDMWTFKDGKAGEHWDDGTIAAPAPAK
jgi:hypothetical protein